MKADIPQKPFSKRGILSVINSLYDPVGLVSPVVLQGRLIQREIMPCKNKSDLQLQALTWDEDLPLQYSAKWEQWKESLPLLNSVKINRSFYPKGFLPIRQELHMFSDASDDAIGHVCYLRSIDANDQLHVTFVSGNSKVAPRSDTSIPRMELCAAVEAVKHARAISFDFRSNPSLFFYTDSYIVLSYIQNSSQRFTRYVERRIDVILQHSSPQDWSYVSTLDNPADLASRPQAPSTLLASRWFSGPAFLQDSSFLPVPSSVALDSQHPLPEQKDDVKILVTLSQQACLFSSLLSRKTKFAQLVNVVKYVIKFSRTLYAIR